MKRILVVQIVCCLVVVFDDENPGTKATCEDWDMLQQEPCHLNPQWDFEMRHWRQKRKLETKVSLPYPRHHHSSDLPFQKLR
jgi:hypothetical protein